MHALQYPSAFQPYLLPPPPQTTSPPSTGFPNMAVEVDCIQVLASLVANLSQDDGTNKSSSPEVTAESQNVVPLAVSPTAQVLTLAELFRQTANAVSANNASPPAETSSSPPKGAREARIKRPMNAFMVWSQIRRQQISATGQKYHNSDISKMLGAEWRLMQESEKQPFVEKAKLLREEHLNQYPDYVYRPRRRKRIAKSTGSVDSVSTEESCESPTALPNQTPLVLSNALLQYILKCNLLTLPPSA